MSFILDDIYGAIYKKYADTAALNTLTSRTTSMEFGMAPKGHDMPYIVVDFVSDVPDFVLNGDLPREDVRVQFTLFDKSRSHAAIMELSKQLDLAYGVEGTVLTFSDSTYSQLTPRRDVVTGPTWDGAVWQMTIDYIMQFWTLT